MDNFIWENRSEEKSRAMLWAIVHSQTITLWQSHNTDRFIFTAQVLKYDENTGLVLIAPLNQKDILKIDKNEVIYIRFPYRSMVCKCRVVKLQKENIWLQIPSDVKLIENRKIQRECSEDEHTVLIEKTKDDIVGKLTHSFGILDQSSEGFGFSISLGKVSLFEIGEILKIVKIRGKQLQNAIMVEIKHISPQIKNGMPVSGSYKIGCKVIDGLEN